MAKLSYYRGVRGSAALATRALDVSIPPPEVLEPGEMRRVPFAGELLGAVRVRSDFAAIPFEAFDRTCAALEAEEQAAYLHLLRLSLGEGRNWCRVRKRELMERVRLSERRMLRVLAALVEKRFVRPLHRDNRGTLWRVYLPREAAGERLGNDVIVGRASELPLMMPAGRAVARPAAAAATRISIPASSAVAARSRAVPNAATLARALACARGQTDPESVATALREVQDLLAEGQRPDRIAAGIETVRRRAVRAHPGEAS